MESPGNLYPYSEANLRPVNTATPSNGCAAQQGCLSGGLRPCPSAWLCQLNFQLGIDGQLAQCQPVPAQNTG